MRKITCPCEQVFNADIPEKVDLDQDTDALDKLMDGSLLSCICPTCNAELNLDLPLTVSWPSRKATIVMVPEMERLALVSGTLSPKKNAMYVVGYAELADRTAVIRDGLEPVVIEALKYRLLQKAKETDPQKNPVAFYEKRDESGELEFHIHGIRETEVAVTRIPSRLYNSILGDWKANPEREDYTALHVGSYLSVRNILLEDSSDA